MTKTKRLKAYIAGDIMSKGSAMLREKERNDIAELGFDFYNPGDNEEINAKDKLDNNEGLAEKIVKADMEQIKSSDVVVIEPASHALGTMAELAIIYGMKELAKEIKELDKSTQTITEFYSKTNALLDKVLSQKVYPHYEDIRNVPNAMESGLRRSFSINQFIYGICIALAGREDGEGMYTWEEILDDLKQLKGQEINE